MECPRKKYCKCQDGRYPIMPGGIEYKYVDVNCPYIQIKGTNVGNFYVCTLGDTYVPGVPRW